MIPSKVRNRFAGSRPVWAAVLFAAMMPGVNPTWIGTAAQDRALTPRAQLRRPPQKPHSPAIVTDAGPNHISWRLAEADNDPSASRPTGASCIELASGLNRWDADQNQWQPAEARFESHPEGYFLARFTQHQATLSSDLNRQAAVELLAPDGVRLRSAILGLALVDAASGRNVLLAELKSCRGVQVSPTEIVYPSAFDGLEADVRYVVDLDRFEQDVIIRRRIPPELVSDLGLDPSQTRLLVLTEFFDPPRPDTYVRRLPLADGQTLTDQELSFGAMRMGPGQASAVGVDGPQIPVHKSWETLDGRQFLIEAVPYLALLRVSESLPALSRQQSESLKARVRRTVDVGTPGRTAPGAEPNLQLPEPRQARSKPHFLETDDSPGEPWSRSAANAPVPPSSALLADGVVIDYALTLTPSISDFTFKSDTTYHIRGVLTLAGTTTIEGGCVVKFAPGGIARIVVEGPVRCLTAAYRPAIFTARDDDSVGEIVPDSTGDPTTCYYGCPALRIMCAGQTLHDLRIAHAHTGIFFHDYSAGTNSVRHGQFVRCGTALHVNGWGTRLQNLTLHNLLIQDAPQALAGYSFNARAEHLTVCQSSQLTSDTWGMFYGTQSSLVLVNSLLVAVPSLGNVAVNQLHCATGSESNGVFQTVGAGGFYLARSTFRNLGTPSIDPTLARELKEKTTSPPALCASTGGTDLNLTPLTARDLDAPDLGYHYDPIDFALGGLIIPSTRTLFVLPGTSLATFGPLGVRLDPAARLHAQGTPLRPVRLFRYTMVQEQSTVWGAPSATPVSVLGTDQGASLAPVGPIATFRFVEFAAPADGGCHLRSNSDTSRWRDLALQDCEIRGGGLDLSGTSTTSVGLRNNLFERALVGLRSGLTLTAANNLFRGGILDLERTVPGGEWVMCDNAFHEVDLRDIDGGILHSHNAYLGPKQEQLLGHSTGNIFLPDFPYAEGPLGDHYHAAPHLVNAGSRSAGDAGLYHHTVLLSQAQEANTIVDIGFHRVAIDVNGASDAPQDTDDDGLADYVEDANGNGVVDSAETDWRDPRDLGLEVRITRPRRSSPVP